MTVRAKDIMTQEVVTASPQDSLQKIAKLLVQHKISAMPVCDPEGKVIGIVTELDLLRPFGSTVQQRRDWWVNFLAEGAEISAEFLNQVRVENAPVQHFMHAPVVMTSEETELSDIAELMSKQGIKRLPVVRDGRLVGIVSGADVIRAIAEGRQ